MEISEFIYVAVVGMVAILAIGLVGGVLCYDRGVMRKRRKVDRLLNIVLGRMQNADDWIEMDRLMCRAYDLYSYVDQDYQVDILQKIRTAYYRRLELRRER